MLVTTKQVDILNVINALQRNEYDISSYYQVKSVIFPFRLLSVRLDIVVAGDTNYWTC